MADNRMREQWQGSTIPSATPVVVVMNGAPLPCTVALKSAAAGRLIEISVDGGTEYFIPPYDSLTTTQLALGLTAPVSHVRLTGAAGDTWSIR